MTELNYEKLTRPDQEFTLAVILVIGLVFGILAVIIGGAAGIIFGVLAVVLALSAVGRVSKELRILCYVTAVLGTVGVAFNLIPLILALA
jgi:membrane associated rhomboid family serine protease